MKYPGYIQRNEQDRWKRRVLKWTSQEGVWNRGRPQRRWEDKIIQYSTAAQFGIESRVDEEAYTLR